jgi:hypothetical protein
MPRRSNAFQRAMYLLRERLADSDTQVTESAEVIDPITGSSREVDILITRRVAGASVVIGVECTDLSGPADVGWVEKMHGKHSHLRTHALVLASSSGFTPEALRVADSLNIETVDIGKVDENLTSKVVGVLQKVYAKACSMTINSVSVTLEATDGVEEETIIAFPDQRVCDETGVMLGPLNKFVHDQLQPREVGAELLRDALPEHKSFTVGTLSPKDPATGKPLCLEKLDPKCIRPIKSFEVRGGLTLALWEVPLRHAVVDGRALAWGEGKFGTTKATLLVDETGAAPLRASFHVEQKSKPERANKKEKRKKTKRQKSKGEKTKESKG